MLQRPVFGKITYEELMLRVANGLQILYGSQRFYFELPGNVV